MGNDLQFTLVPLSSPSPTTLTHKDKIKETDIRERETKYTSPSILLVKVFLPCLPLPRPPLRKIKEIITIDTREREAFLTSPSSLPVKAPRTPFLPCLPIPLPQIPLPRRIITGKCCSLRPRHGNNVPGSPFLNDGRKTNPYRRRKDARLKRIGF